VFPQLAALRAARLPRHDIDVRSLDDARRMPARSGEFDVRRAFGSRHRDNTRPWIKLLIRKPRPIRTADGSREIGVKTRRVTRVRSSIFAMRSIVSLRVFLRSDIRDNRCFMFRLRTRQYSTNTLFPVLVCLRSLRCRSVKRSPTFAGTDRRDSSTRRNECSTLNSGYLRQR